MSFLDENIPAPLKEKQMSSFLIRVNPFRDYTVFLRLRELVRGKNFELSSLSLLKLDKGLEILKGSFELPPPKLFKGASYGPFSLD